MAAANALLMLSTAAVIAAVSAFGVSAFWAVVHEPIKARTISPNITRPTSLRIATSETGVVCDPDPPSLGGSENDRLNACDLRSPPSPAGERGWPGAGWAPPSRVEVPERASPA